MLKENIEKQKNQKKENRKRERERESKTFIPYHLADYAPVTSGEQIYREQKKRDNVYIYIARRYKA